MTPVSIIVPAYRRISQTIQTIQLLLESDGVGDGIDAEVIVADSTPGDDLRLALVRAFKKRVLYTRPSHSGIATNKNQGARMASNRLLIFCDSDMEVEKDTLSRTITSFRDQPTAGALGGTVLWRGGNHDGKPDRPRPEDRMYTVGKTTYVEALYSRYICTYKDIFTSVGGYDENVFNMRGEGSDLSIRYWRAGYPLVYENSIIVHHVYDAPDAAAVRISHPERGIAKDLLLLAYKYKMMEGDYPNFSHTVAANFLPLGDAGYFEFLQGINEHLSDINDSMIALDTFRQNDRPVYPFTFLDVFTDRMLLKSCLDDALQLIRRTRNSTFSLI